jgi:hypothetical protein
LFYIYFATIYAQPWTLLGEWPESGGTNILAGGENVATHQARPTLFQADQTNYALNGRGRKPHK